MTISASNVSPAAPETQAGQGTARERHSGTEKPQTRASRAITFLLCLTLISSALAYGTVHYWSLAIFHLGATLIALLWLLDAWSSGVLRLSRNPLQWPLIGALILGLIQLLPLGSPALPSGALSFEPVRGLTLDPYATRLTLVWLLALLIYFAALLSFLNSRSRLRLFVSTIFIFGFLLAIFGMIQRFTSPAKIYWVRQPSQAVPFGPFINSHHFAAYMLMALALPLGLLFSGAVKSERRPLYIFGVIVMGMSVILTGSRGGMLSLALMLVFLLITTSLRAGRKIEDDEAEDGRAFRARVAVGRLGLGLVLGLALLAGAIFFGGGASVNRLLGTASAQDPTTGRTHFWATTLEIIRHHPFIGAGLGAYPLAYTRYDTWNGFYRVEQAHNDYLQLLADGGMVGGALGLSFIVLLFRMALAQRKSRGVFARGAATGALAGCFAALVHSFFDFPLHTTANAFLFLTLAALATVDEDVFRSGSKRSLPP